MVTRAKHCAVDVRSDDASKLSHGICPANSNASSNSTFEGADTFRPYDWICRASARYSDNECQVLYHRAVHGDEDDVAYDGGALNCE